MARIRTFKPELFTSPTIAGLELQTRWSFIGLLPYVDDAGRGRDDARLIKAAVWPLDDDVTHVEVEKDLLELAAAGLIERWIDDASARPFLRIRSWREHQKISNPGASKIPPSPEESRAALEASREAPEASDSEGNRERGTGNREQGGTTDVVAAAAALVSKKRNEVAELVAELVTAHGGERVAAAVRDLSAIGARYPWPSDLRKAIEKSIEALRLLEARSPRPACAGCAGTTWLDGDDGDAHRCPECSPMAASA